MIHKLPNTPKACQYLASRPTYYAVVLWAKYAVLGAPYSGKSTKEGVPLVWWYCDMNGTDDKYVLLPINRITSGGVYCWTTSEDAANIVAKALNGGNSNEIN